MTNLYWMSVLAYLYGWPLLNMLLDVSFVDTPLRQHMHTCWHANLPTCTNAQIFRPATYHYTHWKNDATSHVDIEFSHKLPVLVYYNTHCSMSCHKSFATEKAFTMHFKWSPLCLAFVFNVCKACWSILWRRNVQCHCLNMYKTSPIAMQFCEWHFQLCICCIIFGTCARSVTMTMLYLMTCMKFKIQMPVDGTDNSGFCPSY